MKGKIIGIIIFVVVVAAAILISVFSGQGQLLGLGGNAVTVKGYVGGEKLGFLADEEVVRILKDKYGLTVDDTRAGSIEMAGYDTTGVDFLFPSSQTAYEIFRNRYGGQGYKGEKVFFSPIVLYSWDEVAKALTAHGLCAEQTGGYFTTDISKLIPEVLNKTNWSDFGLDIYGNFKIISTDPNKSNSGTMYAALLANMLNGGNVVDATSVQKVAGDVKQVFTMLGQMESSSGNMFSRYLNLGMGESPIIVGYENQIIEFAMSDPELWSKVQSKVALIYPEPTVWSEHYLIALTENGEKLLTALMDEDIQRIAWERHGFRTGETAYGIDAQTLEALGISENINKVVPVPDENSMIQLLDYIDTNTEE